MKIRIFFAVMLSLASFGALVGCEEKPASDAVISKLDAMKPEERFAWLKKMGGMSVYMKQAQVDSIKGATPEQKKAWKEELAKDMGGPPAAPGAPSNPMAGQQAPQGN